MPGTTFADVKDMIEEYGFTVLDDVSTIGFIETDDGFSIEFDSAGNYIFYPNDTFVHEIIGKWASEPQSEKEIREYLAGLKRSQDRQRKENYIPKFDEFFKETEDDSVTQHLGHTPAWRKEQLRGSLDPREMRRKQSKAKWGSIISWVKDRLPVDYEYARYVGPTPPTGESEATSVHLQFGYHDRQPVIVAELTRETPDSVWSFDGWRGPEDKI